MGIISGDAHGQPSLSVNPQNISRMLDFQIPCKHRRTLQDRSCFVSLDCDIAASSQQWRFCARLTFAEVFGTGCLVVPEVLLLVEEICS